MKKKRDAWIKGDTYNTTCRKCQCSECSNEECTNGTLDARPCMDCEAFEERVIWRGYDKKPCPDLK